MGILLIVIAALLATSYLVQEQWTKAPAEVTPYVIRLRLSGTIAYEQATWFLGAFINPDSVMPVLNDIKRDSKARAVIIEINSPGGTVTASESLYRAVKDLAANKTIIAYIKETGASGAYMMVLPAKRIVAEPNSLTGSIGVIMTLEIYKRLYEKLGIDAYVFKSGQSKDVGSPYRDPTEEDEEILRGIVDLAFESFKQRVLEHRKLVSQEVFDGRPYAGSRAVEVGLIDEVGNFERAYELAIQFAELPEGTPIREITVGGIGLFDMLGLSDRATLSHSQFQLLAIWPPPLDRSMLSKDLP